MINKYFLLFDKCVIVLFTLLLVGCNPLMSSRIPTQEPTESPWIPGTPQPLFAPPTSECLASGTFPPHLSGTRYGINTFLFATDMDRALTLANIAGFDWIRQQIHWRDLEGERGQYIWKPLDQIVTTARAYHLHIMLSIVRSPAWATQVGHTGMPDDREAFATFLHTIATRYRSRVSAYEIWNEPNLAHEHGGTPGNSATYLALLKAAYPAIKQADPCALVLSAPLAATNNPEPSVATEDIPFFEQLYTLEQGTFLRVADAVAVHPGAGPYPPNEHWAIDAVDESHYYFRHIERIHNIMSHYGDQRQVWITEVGWNVTAAEGAPQPVSEQQQADYLTDMLWYVRQRYRWVAGVLVWNLNFSVIAPPQDEKATFSILRPDWSIRPAFLSMQQTINPLRDVDRSPFLSNEAIYSFAWTFPGRGAMRSSPILSPDGTIYVVSDPGTLYAVSNEGILQWQYDASGMIGYSPTLAPNGMIFVSDSNSLLTALLPSGTLSWTIHLRSPVRGKPIVHLDHIYTVNRVGEVQAFDIQGQEVWSYDVGMETTPLALDRSNNLLVGLADGNIIKLSLDGRKLWQTATGGELWAGIVSDQAGNIFVVTTAGKVVALDTDGAVRWQIALQARVIAPPLVDLCGSIFLVTRNGTIHALRATDGQERWLVHVGSDLYAPPAQGHDGTLYLGTEDERLIAIRNDGTLLWQAHVRGSVHTSPVLGNDETLYVATSGGRLYTFRR